MLNMKSRYGKIGRLAAIVIAALMGTALCLSPGAAAGEVDVTCHITVHNLDEVQNLKTGDVRVVEASADPVDGVAIEDPVTFVSGNESVLEVSENGQIKALRPGTATVWMVVNYSQATWDKLIAHYPQASRLVTADQGQVFSVEVDQTPGSLYRLYNPNGGEHLYTEDIVEQRYLVNCGWVDEGLAWINPVSSAHPVYRLYNPNGGDHHYTASAEERDALVGFGWIYETVAFDAADSGRPVYRLYNPNAQTGAHHFTLDENERNFLEAEGWIYEGISWYALPES